MNNLKYLAVALLVTGCASTGSVLTMGPDTYVVSGRASAILGGSAKAQEDALVQANNYCAAMGKQIVVTNTDQRREAGPVGAKAEVTFRCLAAGDRDLRRPTYVTPPTAVIQDNRR